MRLSKKKTLERDRPGKESKDISGMIGTCPAMRQVYRLIHKVANTDLPLLITGASGTGKEMVAQAIHRLSRWARGPFVVVNCSAIPRELLESELFGHEKGAFTGAHATRKGRVEVANHGTLFLDEVGELPLELQVKLLRFLQEFTFERVGGREPIKVDLRVISATNRNLKELLAEGRFREDLYYRLDGFNIDLPDLKVRGKDIPIMANIFLSTYSAKLEKNIRGFTPEAEEALQAYSWPGNIRELINRIRRAVVMAEDPWVTPENLGFGPSGQTPEEPLNGLGLKEAVAQFEAQQLHQALHRHRGNVSLAAKALKIARSTFYNLVKKHNLKKYTCATLLLNVLEFTILTFLLGSDDST